MVTRKPVAPKPGVQQSSNAQIYPVARKPADGTDSRLSSFGTMSDASSSLESPAFEVRNMHDGHRVSPHGLGGIEMNDPWAEETVERTHAQNRLPAALRIGKGNSTVEKNMEQETVPSLRMGLSEGHPATSEDARRPYNPASQSVWQAGAIANKQQQTPYTPQHPANTFSRNSSTTASVDQHIDKEEQSSAGVWNESAESMPTPPRGSRSPQVDDRTEDGIPVSMTANLSIADRPFSEFSPSYSPSNLDMSADYRREETAPFRHDRQSSIPTSPHDIPPRNAFVAPPPTHQPPPVPSSSELPATPTRGQDSAASPTSTFTHRTTSSIGWDPGLDISALDAATSRNHGLPNVSEFSDSQYVPRTWEEQQAWERKERGLRAAQAAAAAERAEWEERERKAEEEWHKGEENLSRQGVEPLDTTPIVVKGQSQNRERTGSPLRLQNQHKDLQPMPLHGEEPTPALPPRRSQEGQDHKLQKQPQPHLEIPTNRSGPSSSGVETPQSKIKRQRSETYQIKQVNWHDSSSKINPRRSPILVQNANGPCPLLALVNALVISTPTDITTALVETLRVREQVSLGLLLDAVFDELISGRRGGAAQELPDVGDLYTFLVTLHTGMNVNPRFIEASSRAPNSINAPPINLSATINDDRRPGGFEDTREMRLYSTFNIPLIHGWLPPRSHPAYTALERSAKTYEDAQNLLFREEELEKKLEREGLNPDEQILLEDITSIKYFLSSAATQLTEFGLDTITEALYPGSIAILFRNDHFSTLYKHPQSNQLLTLVTDMGYAGHQEVVWESLVDVSGERCEFFAGDFRPVGNVAGDTQPRTNSMLTDDESWTTVERTSNRIRNSNVSSTSNPRQRISNTESRLDQTIVLPSSPATEQEDHDLALALQLQEEEEDRHRREIAARRREDELSQAYLISEEPSNQRGRGRGPEIRPLIPPRGTPGPTNRRGVNEDAPPPTYEQAARGPAYHPPPSHPAHPHAPPGSARPGQLPGRQLSAYSQNAATHGGEMPAQYGQTHRRSSGARAATGHLGGAGASMPRRRSAGVAGSASEADAARKDKDCTVM